MNGRGPIEKENRMRIAFALPGFHKYDRGAEIALIAVAEQLALSGDSVTLIGSGPQRPRVPYHFKHAGSLGREHFRNFPTVPILRSDYIYEELTFVPNLLCRYKPNEYDLTVTCSFPFTNFALRRPTLFAKKPLHVFVTQNGDWPAYSRKSEYRLFGCDGLVCTNLEYYGRNQANWNSCLIPNGVNCEQFKPGVSDLNEVPKDRFVVLMVSALIPSKRVEEGIYAVAKIKDAHLVVAGDGPLRSLIETKAQEYLPGRFTLLSVPAHRMPDVYRAANVFLHMSKSESFGNVYLEAMATGLPIVAQNSDHVRWVVGDNEFLVDTQDAESVSRAISCATQYGSSDKARRIIRAQTFAWPIIASRYRAFFKKLASNA